jgi:hypothetical protein
MSTSALPQSIQPYAVQGGLEGRLTALPLPQLLQHLRLSKATGVLTVTAGGARKAFYVRQGRIVFATSNLPNDRLGELLLREGKITVEEYEASIKGLSKGKRQGKALVEMGALSPKDLWDGVQFQIREIVHSLFEWEEGLFQFEISDLPERERITVDLDVGDLIVVGTRRMPAGGPIRNHFPAGQAVLGRVVGVDAGALESYERHVWELVDGKRTTLEICGRSEIGQPETLKVLYTLLAAGIVRDEGALQAETFDSDFVSEDETDSVLGDFNTMYAFIFGRMLAEVGPITENVFEKYMAKLREERKEVFGGIRLDQDGRLDAAAVRRNLSHIPQEAERLSLLVEALNELLYAELLAVKRTLGAEHETAIIKALQEQT